MPVVVVSSNVYLRIVRDNSPPHCYVGSMTKLNLINKHWINITCSKCTVLVSGAEQEHEKITDFKVHVIVGCERNRESQTAASGYGAGTFGEGPFGG